MGTLEVRSLSRIRDGVLLFDEVSFFVPDGRVTAIAGPAMSGKTSLLRVIAGVERSDGGDVLLDGHSLLRLPTERRHLGFLFDDLALFEDMTVRDNVAFGLRMQRRKRVERLRRTDDVLDALGLGGKADRKPRDLSPGERKRLAFARAVAPEPSLLLLDEPTAGVEEVGREAWRLELAQALRALHVTTVIATTDLRDAVVLADEIVLMAEGQVLQTGSVSRVLQGPASIEAATLAGYVPLVRGEVVEGHVIEQGVGAVAFPAGFPLRQQAAVMAHPTALFGVPGGSGLGSGVSGTLLRARPDGPAYVVEVQLGDRSVALRWEWDLTPPDPGASVEIAVRPGTLRFFNDSPAPRVRSAESATVAPERFAVLAPRVVAGADAPGPRASQPPPPDEPLDVPAPPALEAISTTDGGDEDSSPPRSDARAAEPASGPRSVEDAGPLTPRPDTRTEATPAAARPAGEPTRSPDAAVDPVRVRPNRPTPPPAESVEPGPVEEHSTSDEPAPASAPPPKADERHSGMPLD